MMEFQFASKSFDNTPILEACRIDFEVGKVTALLGPSGVGKTTLLRLIAGLESDDSGLRQTQHRVGMVFQEPLLMPWLTVCQNVELAGPEDGWLARLGLSEAAQLYPRQLSLGMARRVALARAMAFKPHVLVLDEPFASLDAATSAQVKSLLRETFRAHRVTVVLVSHDPVDVTDLAHASYRLEGRPARLMRA